MRVTHVIDTLTWGGAEALLADAVHALRSQGVESSVVHLKDLHGSPMAERLRRAGVEPVLAPISALVSPRALRTVRAAVRATRPDVVHTHLGYSDMLGGLAARSLGVPFVCTLHVMRWERSGREGVKERLFARVRRHAAARVIAVSDAARAEYLATGWDVPAHVVTVHNGIARRPQAGAGPEVRRRLGLGEDDLVAATVSVLRDGKGHAEAAEAVAALRRTEPRLRLLVCGDGPDRERVRDVLAPLGEGAVMAGHVEDVMEVLDAVDVLVHPTHVDAFPTSLIEAAAAGVPVIATAVGGVPEIVEDGVTGALLAAPPRADDLATALRRLLADPALRRAYGHAATERFAIRFAPEPWGRALTALYDEVR